MLVGDVTARTTVSTLVRRSDSMDFNLHFADPFNVAEPNYLGLPWSEGTTFHLRRGPRPDPWSLKAVERLPLLAIMDVNFAHVDGDRLGYLHFIRRETAGFDTKGDGTVSSSIVRLVEQTKIAFLVFHTALMPDGKRLVERLRPAAFVKARIGPGSPHDTPPVWVIGRRDAITRHLLANGASRRGAEDVRWFKR